MLPLYKPTSTIPPHITFTPYPISHPTSHPHPISHIPPTPCTPQPPPSRIPPHSHTHSPSSGSCCRLSALCRACCSSRASISLFFCAISSSCCRIFAVVLADFDCATPNHRLAFPEGEKIRGGRDYRPLQREEPPERGAPFRPRGCGARSPRRWAGEEKEADKKAKPYPEHPGGGGGDGPFWNCRPTMHRAEPGRSGARRSCRKGLWELQFPSRPRGGKERRERSASLR